MARYILSISTSTAILENVAIPRFDLRARQHRAVAARSQRLHEAAAAGRPLYDLENRLEHLAARLCGLTDEQVSEIRESYGGLTMADLREARQADEGDDEGDADAGAGEDSTDAVVSALDGNGEMTVVQIASVASLNGEELGPLLRQLIEKGRFEQVGRGRGTRYRLAKGGEA